MTSFPPFRYYLVSLLLLIGSGCKKPLVEPEEQWVLEFAEPTFTTARNLGFGYSLPLTLNGLPIDKEEVQWSTTDPEIAFVTDDGYIYGYWAGETNLTASLKNGKATASCQIIVTDDNAYMFRLVLTDKGTDNYSTGQPNQFLSQRALARRQHAGIAIDERDLPISEAYLQEIAIIGGSIVAKSKWLGTVTVYCDTASLINHYRNLPFVAEAIEVWQGAPAHQVEAISHVPVLNNVAENKQPTSILSHEAYGKALKNIDLHNGQSLHEKGYTGSGMAIAVIDAGFQRLPANVYFTNSRIHEVKSFIHNQPDPFALDEHGVWVSSCMAVNKPGEYIGTAPDADYWLFSTEVRTEEFPVEEDYWVAALEYADSVGVAIVNSSLSYTYRDGFLPDYTYEDMDGKTAFCSRGAAVAVSKGMLIVNSAGNHGSWVGAPADVADVLTLGAVSITHEISGFTAFGVTVDGRMKPDVVSLGAGTNVVEPDNYVSSRSGTSYASPIMCGLAACLWQAYPSLSNLELLDVIRQSSDRYLAPEIPYGHGLPDMVRALVLADKLTRNTGN